MAAEVHRDPAGYRVLAPEVSLYGMGTNHEDMEEVH